MKSTDLLCILGDIDDSMIAEAKNHKKSRRNTWVKWSAFAACLCLMVFGFVNWQAHLDHQLAPIGTEKDNPGQPDTQQRDFRMYSVKPELSVFYEAFYQEGDAPAMKALDRNDLDSFYPGLTDISCHQLIAYSAKDRSVPAEVVLVEVENTADADRVAGILEARVAYQVENIEKDFPKTAEGWKENSEIVCCGNYVALFVADAKDTIAEAFRSLYTAP